MPLNQEQLLLSMSFIRGRVPMSRIMFQRASINFRTVQGELIKKVQQLLKKKGFYTDNFDGIYGHNTEAAILTYQQQEQLQPTGNLDEDTWKKLTSQEPPSIQERCLQLTADFEGTGFTKLEGNFDGAGLTWGIIGFTLGGGELQKLLKEIQTRHEPLFQKAFGSLTNELLQKMDSPLEEQKQWAESISIGKYKTQVQQQWEEAFAQLGSYPEVQAIQIEQTEKYWNIALSDARKFNLKTELGLALCFDIAVQNGGIGSTTENRIQQKIREVSPTTEQDLRIIIADAVAENSNHRWIEDVRKRKQLFATGQGEVHGNKYEIKTWGLGEFSTSVSSLTLAGTTKTTDEVETNTHNIPIPMTTIADYQDCETDGLRALDLQLIAEMNRLQPGILTSFANEKIVLGGGAHDCLQTNAVKALQRAVQKRGVTLEVNSAYRTIPQQFVLRNQLEQGRCERTEVAEVGQSKHNEAVAIDIEDHAGWLPYLEEEEWHWLGADGSPDVVHFDYRGGGTINLKPLTVRAFQSLWNLNHPEDKIAEDGIWGPGTKERLLKTPVSGFAKTYVSSQPEPKKPLQFPPPKKIIFGTMREGATGEQVKRLQYALNAHGVEVTVDGNFRASTTEAVRAFQQQEGLGADGVVGTMTLEALGLIKHS